MEVSDVEKVLAQLRLELGEAKAAEATAAARRAALQKVIEGYLDLYPEIEAAEFDFGTNKPRGADAIVQVMSDPEHRGRFWTVASMLDVLTANDWLPDSTNPSNAVRTAMARAAETDPRIVKGVGRNKAVLYFFRAPGMPEPRFDGERTDVQSRLDEAFPEAQTEVFPPYDRHFGPGGSGGKLKPSP